MFWYRIIERSRDWLRLRLTSDRRCVLRQFVARHGYPANLDHPETWSEKIQWIKLYDRDPLYTLCSDKYRARDYVGELTFTPGAGCDPFVPEAVDLDWSGRFSVADLRP